MIQLGKAQGRAIVQAPIASIDLGEWLFTLGSEDYAACAKGHQSAAQGQLPSGKRVSMNVETVGGFFMVQHYVEDLTERDHVRAISPNSLIWLDDVRYVQAEITWKLAVQPLEGQACTLTCTVTVATANEAFAKASLDNLAQMSPEDIPLQVHINEETPLFAKDIEQKALTGIWN